MQTLEDTNVSFKNITKESDWMFFVFLAERAHAYQVRENKHQSALLYLLCLLTSVSLK